VTAAGRVSTSGTESAGGQPAARPSSAGVVMMAGIAPLRRGSRGASARRAPRVAARRLPEPRRRVSDVERPWRAVVLIVLGGLMTLAVSLGMRHSGVIAMGASDVGTIIGGLAIALGLLLLARPDAAWLLGAGAVLVGVVSFPMSLGGLVIGSLFIVLGGALAAAWSPAPDDSTVEVRAAPIPRRLLAAAVDVGLLAALATAVGVGALNGVLTTWGAYGVVTVVMWIALVLPSTLLAGATAGKWLVDLRVDGADEPPQRRAVVGRELVRFVAVALTASIVVGSMAEGAGVVGTVVVGILMTGAWAFVLWTEWVPHDRLAGTTVVHHRLVTAAGA
jgi:hypothetical protein